MATTLSPSLQIRARARLELIRRAHARGEDYRTGFWRPELSLAEWLPTYTPTYIWTWPHLVHVREHLDQVTAGEIPRLMLFLPPRHGKSELTTVRYPVFRLERDPQTRIIIGAYNHSLAARFSRRARRIAAGRLALSEERAAAHDWETAAGGGVRAVGVGSGVTGMGADLIVIDDPVKSREEADSEAYRERVWDWYTNDIYTRLEPGAGLILIMTRWHEDDLAGRILASPGAESWTVVSLPAEAEEGDPLGREIGEALCPERYDAEALAEIRTVLGRDYIALYQQRPQPRGGGMFRREWFEILPALPAGCRMIRYWDKAATTKKGSAYSVGVLMAEKENLYHVVDVARGRWSPLDRERVIRQTAELDRQRYGEVVIWLEQEPGSGGLESAQATVANLAGFVVYAERPTGDKETRAAPFAAQAEARNVKLIAGPWNGDYLGELASFPAGVYKDQVDASSGAFNKLARALPAAGVIEQLDTDTLYRTEERRSKLWRR